MLPAAGIKWLDVNSAFRYDGGHGFCISRIGLLFYTVVMSLEKAILDAIT